MKLIQRQGESGSQHKVRLLTSKKLVVQKKVEGAGRGMGGGGGERQIHPSSYVAEWYKQNKGTTKKQS